MVHLTGKGHADGWCDNLLEKAANLALGVDLGAENGSWELVLGTESRDTLLGRATHHRVASSELQVDIDTSLDLVGQTPPVATLETTLREKLSTGNPVIALVLSSVAESSLGAHATARLLKNTFKAKRKARSDSLQVWTDEHAGQAALQNARVDALQAGAEVCTSVILLERDLGGARASSRWRLNLDLRLEAEAVGDALVETAGERKIGVKLRLAESLRMLVNAHVMMNASSKW
jgi:hypothetical protein